MKKLLSLLLVLAMLTGVLAACSSSTCKEHVDADKNGVCDVCEAEVPIPCDKHTDEDLNNICDKCGATLTNDLTKLLGIKIVKVAKDQIDTAKSVKITFDVQASVIYTKNGEAVENDGGVYTYTIYLNRTEEGVDYKVHTLSKILNAETGAYVTELDAVTQYKIGSVVYMYDAQEDTYWSYDTSTSQDGTAVDVTLQLERLEAALVGLLNDYAMSEEELEEVGSALVTAFSIVNGKGSLSVDLKPHFDSLKAYIMELDPETKTVRSLFNDILALADPSLTVEQIVDTIEDVGAMNVAEALSAIDIYLTDEYGKTLQGLYDELLANENAKVLIASLVLVADATPEEQAQFDAWYGSLQAQKIADLIPEEMKAMTVYDLFALFFAPKYDTPDDSFEDGGVEMMSDEELAEPDYITLEETIAQLNMLLDSTLADLEMLFGLPTTTLVESAQMIADGTEVKELNAKMDLDFDNIYKLKSMTLTLNLEMSGNYFGIAGPAPDEGDDEVTELNPATAEGTEEVDSVLTTIKVAAAMTVSEISDTAVTITAPTNVTPTV
ncbi:MAG: hypothetical protein IJ009_03595 [Clostridia bacterium]|nr:hypothetical protein [Clostridia bacterium]